MLRVFSSLLSLALASSAATLPLYFEPNILHPDSPAQFLSRGNGVTSYLAGPGAAFTIDHSNVMMKLAGAHAARGQGMEKLPGTSSYFLGRDPKAWRTGVPQYGQ